MTDSAFFYQLIVSVSLIIPIATLIWKAAKQSSKLEEHEKRITELEDCVKTDVAEIKESINQLNIEFTKSFTELSTAINFIRDGLKDK